MAAMKILLLTLLSSVLLTLLPIETQAQSQANTGWTLNNSESVLSFISIKATDIAEVHHFTMLSGSISDDGSATVDIELASLETMIPVRNVRMLEMLFEVKVFPLATITTAVDMAVITAMQPGAVALIPAEVLVELHGDAVPMVMELRVTRITDTAFSIASQQPIIVNAGMFNLVDGIEKLREVAGLPSISKAVPVSFTLRFDHN